MLTKQSGPSQLNSLAEATHRKMDETTLTFLGRIKEVHEECLERPYQKLVKKVD